MGTIWKCSGMMLFGALAMTAQAADLGDLPDPTRPHGASAGNLAPSGVQSILISPQRKVAVVYGRTVTVGDRVGDAVVMDIRPYEVILNRGGRESRLRLVPRMDKTKSEDS